jgi:hypothetical protein
MGLESKAHRVASKATHVVERYSSPAFVFSVVLVHILYLAVFLGVVYIDESYIRYLSTLIQCFVAIFLTIRFNPYNDSYSITEFDKQTIFYSATFLLLNVVATEVYTSFIKSEKTDAYIKDAKTYIGELTADIQKNVSNKQT